MAQVEQVDAGHLRVMGVLDFSTVTALFSQIHQLGGSTDDLELDFSSLERSNSAGLALLLELLDAARKQNRKITFSGIPPQLLDLARMSNVEHLLNG